MRPATTFALLACMLATAATAQQPSTDDIVNKLVQPQPGLRQVPWGQKGLNVETDEVPPSIDLHIPFEYNSDKLTPDAFMTLRRLGDALRDPRLGTSRFRIAGHTDAKGTLEYNRMLSERRAQAVRDYLVFQYDVEPGRLEIVGYGYSRPADPGKPMDAINRRVQVMNIGPAR